jgi:hypothetical protein
MAAATSVVGVFDRDMTRGNGVIPHCGKRQIALFLLALRE